MPYFSPSSSPTMQSMSTAKRGPHHCRPLQVSDTLRLAALRRPRRLNVHVSRTLKAATSGKFFIPRNLAFDARSSRNNTRWAVTPGSYPPIFIGVSRSIHIVMGVYPKVNQIYTPISKEFPTPTRWLQPCRPVIPVAPSFR